MKIGLLTYYGDLNCGTNLQAYATLLALKRAYKGNDVEIIPFHGFHSSKKPYKTFSLRYIYRDLFRFKKYADFKKQCLNVTNDVVITDVTKGLDYISSRNYDAIYVGADTLLELDHLPKGYDGASAYWLKDIKAKKVLIAASSKNVSFEKLTDTQREELTKAAKQFTYIGVRDRATMNLFECLLRSKDRIRYVPDPTFILDIDYSPIEKYLNSKKVNIPKKSVFIQFFSDDFWLAKEVKQLKNKGYTIITNRGVAWSDVVLIDMSPLEQIGLYKYVSFVISPRFHDGVFCMMNHTPALLYVKSSKIMMAGDESKHVSLLKDFGLYPFAYLGAVDSDTPLKNIWDSYNETKRHFQEDRINEILEKNKQAYLSYLDLTKENL